MRTLSRPFNAWRKSFEINRHIGNPSSRSLTDESIAADCASYARIWVAADLAVQFRMGILSKRRRGSGISDPADCVPCAAASDLTARLLGTLIKRCPHAAIAA